MKQLFRIISDLDDTIKISNTQDKLATAYRGVFRSSSFCGMAELFQEWWHSAGNAPIDIVSSSPQFLKKRVIRFLIRNRFPPTNLRLRHWIKEPNVQSYKLEALHHFAAKYREPLILLGDDTEHDPEIFHQFSLTHPKRIAAVYIHQVKARPIREGFIPFFTAFDIACAEVKAGRLNVEQAIKIGKAVTQARKARRLIPSFAAKLPEHFFPDLPEDKRLVGLWGQIQKRLRT